MAGEPNGDRSGEESPYWALASDELNAALSTLSELKQTDARTVSAALLLTVERLRSAADHILRAMEDDRDQG